MYSSNTDFQVPSFKVRYRNILSIYEIVKRALFAEFLMNENESNQNMICEKCMVTWENYYEYLSKYFDEIIPRWMLENNLNSLVLSDHSKNSI